jgi:hypothetical protein
VTVCSDIADYRWLTGDEACGLLAELADHAAPLHAMAERLRGRLPPERTHLLLEQLDLRRRAAAKFSLHQRMFFTRLGLEQATDQWIAAYKASRFTGRRAGSSPTPPIPTPAIADLCCGIGGDLMALAGQDAAVGVDCNPIAAHFAAANTGASTRTANAADYDLRDFTAWHIDPDRRPRIQHASLVRRRTTSLEFSQPDLAAIERLLAHVPHAAVKLAPATKVPADWTERCELEWISRDRECRQLVAWHGNLAHSPGKHCATVLSAACDLAPRTVVGVPHQPIPILDAVDRYIFDLDPAILAASLKGVLAAEHNLFALAPGPTYLTGPCSIHDPALACFEVLDVFPFQPRKLAPYLRERSIGQLEIKKRGLDLEPEKLRRDLKLRGDNAATLLLTRVTGRPTAIVARRV